jgi:hypothetical protein
MIGPLTELPLRFLRVGLSGLLGANFARSWLRFPYVFTCRAFGLAWPLLRALALSRLARLSVVGRWHPRRGWFMMP